MNDTLISAYIDNELSLADKIVFVESVHDDRLYKNSVVELLTQEQLLRSDVAIQAPVPKIRVWRKPRLWPRFGHLAAAAAAGLALAAIFFGSPQERTSRPYRFVIYRPEAKSVELAGSFSEWKKIPLKHAGNSGYWEITIDLPGGDHRFSYIIEGDHRLADPTIPVRETDDFGGENSILTVNLKA